MKALMWTPIMRGVSASVIALASALPASLSAQAKKCDINESGPYQINGARTYVVMAANAKKPDEIPKHLANAIRVLTDNPEKINNEPGRQYLLVRAHKGWLRQGNASFEMKRGVLGFTTNPTGTHNLLLGLDSAVTAVERLMPECASLVRPFRDEFALEIYNRSVGAMTAEQNDSSIYFAKLALQVSSTDPRPWNVLSAVYQKQNKVDSAMLAMEKVIALAGTDSIFKKAKQQSRYNLAVIKLANADAAKGEEKDRELKRARALLEEYLKDSPGEAAATQALGRAMRLAGDTAAVASVFGDMLKTPEKFTADQLFESASNAAAGARDKDAVTLFEFGLAKNPNHRLALLNLSNALFQLKDAEKMGPVTERLTRIDPNNPDSWRMRAGYWQIRQRAETDAAKKKAYADSTLAAIKSRDGVNPKISIFLAAKAGNTYQVQGSVSNETDKAASYTLKFELLDETGAVVTTKEVAVGPVDGGASATFAIKVDGPKIVAYRYAPIK